MFEEVHDISVVLGAGAITYPGDTPYQRSVLSSIEEGADYELARLEMSAHAGTHLDAPAHFEAGGRRIDSYAARELIFPAHVVDVADPVAVRGAAIAGLAVEAGDAVLFRTENSRSGRCSNAVFTERYTYVTAEAIAALTRRGAGLVGIDYLSVDPPDDDSYPAHHAALGAGLLVLEGIDLGAVAPGRYTLLCLPLRIAGGDAAPARALLVR